MHRLLPSSSAQRGMGEQRATFRPSLLLPLLKHVILWSFSFFGVFFHVPRGAAQRPRREVGGRPSRDYNFQEALRHKRTTTPGVPPRAGINKLHLYTNKLHLPAPLARGVRPASSPFALRRADKRSAHTQRGRWRRFPSGEGGGRGGRGKREGRGVGGVGRRRNPRGGSPEGRRQPGRARVLPAVGRG